MEYIKYLLMKIIFILFSASVSLACHNGDFESTAKGHHKWGKKVGLFQFTENTTITSATLTSCDIYTAFLENQYDFLQEQVAMGNGPHLDALAFITGCEDNVRSEFFKTLRVNYIELFLEVKNSQVLKNGIEKIIVSNPTLKNSCRKA